MLITAALAWMARLSDCTRLEQLSSLTESSTRIPGQMPTIPVPLADALATAATAVPCSSVTAPVDVLVTCPVSSLWLSLACELASGLERGGEGARAPERDPVDRGAAKERLGAEAPCDRRRSRARPRADD